MDNTEDFDDNYGEVFFGRLTLKEVKKRIFMDVNKKNIRLAAYGRNNFDDNSDFKIIETNSQPNMLLASHSEEMDVEHLKSTSDPVFNRNKPKFNVVATVDSEDSFLEIEKNVKDQCTTSNNCDSNNLDNTLEFVDFILNHAQSHNKEKNVQDSLLNVVKQEKQKDGNNENEYFNSNKVQEDDILTQFTACNEKNLNKDSNNTEKLEINIKSEPSKSTPVMCKKFVTPSKSANIKPEVSSALNTPDNIKKETTNIFKTPKIPLSSRKDTCTKKTPSRSKTYEHIASPIANYIKNCPQVPLVKEVHPKKPLPSMSLIPKLLKNAPESNSNKENVVLPQLAYRSAKKTVVIDVNKEKLPRSLWAQKLTSSLQKPVVLKHNHRETSRKPFSIQQEDSFQDLSLHQAEVSVCTEKLAFNK